MLAGTRKRGLVEAGSPRDSGALDISVNIAI
jgi:hypothetical protein